MNTSETPREEWLSTGEAARRLSAGLGRSVSKLTVQRMCDADPPQLRFYWQLPLTGRTQDVRGYVLRGRRRVDPVSVDLFVRGWHEADLSGS